MLKLPKGLKKKKKGKKSKKDQELFTEEELAQYKREHQHHQEGEEAHCEEPQSQHQQEQEQQGGGENDDEWRKFAALTTGIDSILKKTQGDLDRIKSTSFFKRVEPKVVKEEPKQEEKLEVPEEAACEQVKEEELDPAKKLLNAVVELSESESDSEVDDTAFDTTFLEKVETGEIPVYYIPEEEEDLGPDPFDTGYADKVITGPEVSKRGKKIVNIGAAVEVLTGKTEAPVSAATKKRRQRRGIQNLLLESFELEQEEDKEEPLEPETTTLKTILDEPPELAEEVPIDLSVSLHLAYQPPKVKTEEEDNKEILDDFDVIAKDDLFLTDTLPKQEADNTDWSEFELDRSHFPSRPPPPTRPPPPQKQTSDDFDLSDDPFDTEYVEKIVPKSIEYDDEFDPRAAGEEEEEQNLFESGKAVNSLSVAKNDLLNASHNDLASIAPTLAPEEQEEPEEIDPFDTSAVDKLVQPGKTELKFIEKELLDENKKKDSLSDDDFDPRADEDIRPSAEELKHRKSSLSLQVGSRLVSFNVPTPDLLKVEAETSSKNQKPLTPYYHRESIEEDQLEEDPFDTSFVPHIAPTKVELDLIEKEILIQEPTLKHSISDPDFDPRAITPIPVEEKQPEDLFLTADSHDIKVLTPAKESSPEEIEVDPFDTSIAANIVPGTTELRLLEDELIEKKPIAPPPTDILSDTQDNSLYVKILTPQPTGSLDIDNDEDFDPFDTSFATNLAPGETEIKLIENEFIN